MYEEFYVGRLGILDGKGVVACWFQISFVLSHFGFVLFTTDVSSKIDLRIGQLLDCYFTPFVLTLLEPKEVELKIWDYSVRNTVLQ